MFWKGLELALTTAPMYSDIICFTDAVGKDGEVMPAVFALAKARFARVSIITSLISRAVTTVDDYKNIVAETGGLIIAETGDVGQLAQVIKKTIEGGKSTVAIFAEQTGANDIEFAVDDFWKKNPEALIEIIVAGGASSAVLNSSDGRSVDVLNTNSSLWDVTTIIKTNGILYFSFRPDVSGQWTLSLDSTFSYTVRIDASCTFSFLSDFR